MSAPLLYKELQWYHVARKNALGLVKKGNVIKVSRMDTKETELKHIQLIELLNHTEEQCEPTGLRARRSPLVVPVIRFAMSNHEGGNYYGDRACLEYSDCPHLKGLAAKRLVVVTNGGDDDLRLNRNNTSHLEELVVHLKISQYGLEGPTKLLLQGTPKRLVVVLSHPAKFFDVRYRPEDEVIFTCMLNIAKQLVHYARLRQSPLDIVLVNFETFDDWFDGPESELITFGHALKDSWRAFEASRWPPPPGRQWRTASEAALVSFKHLSTAEYKRDYDHAGVYPRDYPSDWRGDTASFGGSDYGGHM